MKREMHGMHKETYKELFLYLVTVLGVILTWYVVLQIWRADWNIPFDYGTELGTDVFGVSTWLKSYIESGFSWEKAGISVPFSADRTGFGVDRIILLVEIISAHIFPTYGGALNFLYLLSFIWTGITTLYTLRNLKISGLPSFAGAMIYTFLQYHLMRGEMHIYLSFYHMAPLTVLVILWLVNEGLLSECFSKHIWGRIKYAYVVFALYSLLLGLENPYYSFYAAISIAFASFFSMCQKRFAKAAEGMAYLLIIALTTLAGNINALLGTSDIAMEYIRQQRTMEAIETYGLKIVNLLLPVQNHRFSFLARVRQHYDVLVGAGSSEETWISLGLILASCFCIALIAVLVNNATEKRIRVCGSFILVFVLISTIGGGSSVIGLFFSMLRCYNRMVVFIAMFCVIVFATLAEKVMAVLSSKGIPWMIQCTLLAFVTVFGIWDQTTPANVYAYENTKEEYLRDERFVREIESMVPEGASIFELPMLPTGTTSIGNLKDYELYKPYLHAETTRWLHMYSVGSQTDQWVNILQGLPLRTVIDVITCCGFQGVYIDSRGYTADELEEVLAVMDSIEGTSMIRSEDGLKIFYSLTAYSARLLETLGAEKVQEYADFWLNCFDMAVFSAPHLSYTENVPILEDTAVIPPGVRQFGPYITVEAGEYMVYVTGNDLGYLDFDVAYAQGTAAVPITVTYADSESVEYVFHCDTDLTALELRSINNGKEDAAIKTVFLLKQGQPEQISIIREFLEIQENQ